MEMTGVVGGVRGVLELAGTVGPQGLEGVYRASGALEAPRG